MSKNLARQMAGLRIIYEGELASGAWKNITVFNPEGQVSEFDTLLFAMTLIQGKYWNSDVKVYVSRLANELSVRNAEMIATLIDESETLILNPCQCAVEGMHESSIENAVRNAQIMSLYPKIEQARANVVMGMYSRLEKLVPFADEYGTVFENPEDVELRHMVYFAGSGDLQLNAEAHSKIRFLYTLRNKLAHRQIVEGEDAIVLLNNP